MYFELQTEIPQWYYLYASQIKMQNAELSLSGPNVDRQGPLGWTELQAVKLKALKAYE